MPRTPAIIDLLTLDVICNEYVYLLGFYIWSYIRIGSDLWQWQSTWQCWPTGRSGPQIHPDIPHSPISHSITLAWYCVNQFTLSYSCKAPSYVAARITFVHHWFEDHAKCHCCQCEARVSDNSCTHNTDLNEMDASKNLYGDTLFNGHTKRHMAKNDCRIIKCIVWLVPICWCVGERNY